MHLFFSSSSGANLQALFVRVRAPLLKTRCSLRARCAANAHFYLSPTFG